MRVICTGVLAAALVAAVGVTVGVGQPPSDANQGFGATTTAVMVDVVVRDRQGRPVTDLAAADFELYEDGVRQPIGNLSVVAPGRGREAAEGAGESTGRGERALAGETAEPPRTVETPTFVALVFDRLSPEARALAHKGALAYLDTTRPDDFAGVFLIDLHLDTIQTYTNDRARLRKAIDEVATRATTTFSREAYRVKIQEFDGDPHAAASPTASAEEHGPPDPRTQDKLKGLTNLPPQVEIAIRMARWMEQAFESLMRDQQGFATTNALLALTDALGRLPGRKTVVFFAESLAIPANVQARFDSVVATANRANVSVYTVDAAGLRAHSKVSETARQVKALGELGLDERRRDDRLPWTTDLERNEDVLRQDPSAGLGILANRTGGFLVDNTNDLADAFRRIDADRRFHYLLTYTPTNTNFDGAWRSIEVKVPGRRVTVRARSGYLALRSPGALPLLTHEARALAALDRTPPPSEIPIRAAALVFPAGAESRLAVLAATSGHALTFAPDEAGQSYRTDFTILARVRTVGPNASSAAGATGVAPSVRGAELQLGRAGEIIRKASQPYRLSGPLANRDAAQQGEVLFFRQPTLPPGAYTLEVVVHDALAGRAGVTTVPLDVPPADALPVGSLVVVRRAERVPADEPDDENPLRLADVLLYPNLGEPVSKREPALTLFVTIGTGAPPGTKAILEVERAGQRLAALPVTLEPPDATGRIRQLVQLPTAALPAGSYTLRLVVSDGTREARREAGVTIVE